MASLFSINFNFEKQTHMALVSMRQEGLDLCCFVRYIDKNLHYILPGDSFVFSLGEGMKQPSHLPNKLAQNLVACTTGAIANHLQTEQNY
jgi:hypothetical protein